MNKRELKLDEYGISGKRYKELCGFCEQYPEWVDELKYNTDTVKSKVITDMPVAPVVNGDNTADLAIRREELQKKVDIISEAANEAGKELHEFIIKSVCYEMPLWYLRDMLNMPCSRTTFYDVRRYFFYLLDKKKK